VYADYTFVYIFVTIATVVQIGRIFKRVV